MLETQEEKFETTAVFLKQNSQVADTKLDHIFFLISWRLITIL